MVKRTFDDLITYMKNRRVQGYDPPVLLLGAGASFGAGIGTMDHLFKFFGVKNFVEFAKKIKTYTVIERYNYLSEFLQTQNPADVTPGYSALAALLAEKYFDLILTTNFDPLLEDALANARLWRRDYVLFINGIMRPEPLAFLLKEPRPRVKIIKVHGDLFHRHMAWTAEEMEEYIKDIKPQLAPVLSGRDIFIVGYSLSDKPMRDLVVEAGGEYSTIWFLHPSKVPETLKSNNRVRAVLDAACKFEELFPRLAKALDILEDDITEPPSFNQFEGESFGKEHHKRTIDDLMASVVGLMPADGSKDYPICTGFILSEPRLIVTEGFSFNTSKEGTVKVVTGDKQTFVTSLVNRDKKHPFGPVCFEVPQEINTPGLRLNPHPLTVNMGIRIGVAVGEKVGISAGFISDINEKSLQVIPIGMVNKLIVVDCVVAPGSAGAPVVDAATLEVLGYIVAGSTNNPPSYMYPAYLWADHVVLKP
ncbi:MAG: SIR2 family protein [Chitinophagaceae bacterium]